MKIIEHTAVLFKLTLATKLFLVTFFTVLSVSAQTIDTGGALGNATSSLVTIDRIDYKDISASWANSIKVSNSFVKFNLDIAVKTKGKLYVITSPLDLGFNTATQIKNFVVSGSSEPGYRTININETNEDNWIRNIAIIKDNIDNKIYNLIGDLGEDYMLYIAYEDASGNLDSEIISEPIALIREYENIELDHTSSPPYAYKLAYPLAYFNAESEKKFPVVVFLHGAGGGKDGAAGSPIFTTPREKGFSCLTLRPASGGGSWKINKMGQLIDHIKTTYADIIDPNRIYFMGFSMGSRGVWDLAINHGDKVAGVVITAGGFLGNNNDVPGMDFRKVIDLPLWAYHNCDDGTVPLVKGWEPINKLVSVGGKPKFIINTTTCSETFAEEDAASNLNPTKFAAEYRVYEGSKGKHKNNSKFFHNEELFTWLFSQNISDAGLNTEAFSKTDYKIFPNPFRNKVSIFLPDIKAYNMVIYDLAGKVVKSKDLYKSNNVINLKDLVSGAYIINLKSKNAFISRKLIKE